MNPKPENKRFFSGIVKKAANVAGVSFVNEAQQSQVPQKEFATAPTVNSNEPVMGEVKTTQVDFDKPAAVVSAPLESPLGQIPPVPEAQSVNTLDSVPSAPVAQPPAPEAPSAPVPDTIQNAFQNDSQDTLNPTIVSPRENESATMAPSAVDAPPVIVPAEEVSAPEPQNTEVSNMAPVVPSVPPETPLATNSPDVSGAHQEPSVGNLEPVVVSPSIATPEIVPSDHIVENETVETLNTLSDTSKAESEDEHFENEASDVPEDPVMTDILLSDPEKYISKDGIINMEEVRAAKFAKEVMKNPTAANLFKQLHSLGVTREDAVEKLLAPFIK